MNRSMLIAFILVLLCNAYFYAQTEREAFKIDEYGLISSDAESGRLDILASALMNEKNASALIVVHTGKNGELLGNIDFHIIGMKKWLTDYRKVDSNRIEFKITSGKKPLFKEIWIIPQGASIPEFARVDTDLNSINSKLLYARTCLSCEPSIPELSKDRVKLTYYVDALTRNNSHTALILIEKGTMWNYEKMDINNGDISFVSSTKMAGIIRRTFREDYKIENRQVKIRFINKKDDVTTHVYYYLIPSQKKKKIINHYVRSSRKIYENPH